MVVILNTHEQSQQLMKVENKKKQCNNKESKSKQENKREKNKELNEKKRCKVGEWEMKGQGCLAFLLPPFVPISHCN
jgi:hypothetical protein